MKIKKTKYKQQMVYGPRFPIAVHDAMPKKPAMSASNRRKLEKVVMLLEQMLAREEKRRKEAARDRFGKMCAASQAGYNSRFSHREDHYLSIPVENTPETSHQSRKVGDAASEAAFQRLCMEAQAAYSARNPHSARR